MADFSDFLKYYNNSRYVLGTLSELSNGYRFYNKSQRVAVSAARVSKRLLTSISNIFSQ